MVYLMCLVFTSFVLVFTWRIYLDSGDLRKTCTIGEGKNTVTCSCDKNGPWISAFEVHEWINETNHLDEQAVLTI
jgi:hypothetical protein